MKTNSNLKKIVIVAIFFIFAFVVSTSFPQKNFLVLAEENNLSFLDATENSISYAKSMVVLEPESGRILYQKNCNEKLPMASTTKIMTAYVALKHAKNLDEKFVVDVSSVGVEGTSLYLRKGEVKTLRELLYGLMLPSGNDAAVAIACHISGTEEEFVKLMNQEAQNLGLKNTNFANAHGLDKEGHYTSAYDLAKITAKAMENETFREIAATKNIKVSGNEEVAAKLLKNKNKLLWSMEGCEGVKTGYTDNARRCFVASAKRNGMRLICVVLNCGPMFEEAERFLNLAFDNYKMYNLLSSYSPNRNVLVENGEKEEVETLTRRHFSLPLTSQEYQKIEYNVNLPSKIEAPVEKEQELGTLEIKLNENVLFEEKIYSQTEIKSTKFLSKVEEIVNQWN